MNIHAEQPRLLQPRQTLSMKFRAVAATAYPYERVPGAFLGNCYGYALHLDASFNPADLDMEGLQTPAALVAALEQDGLMRTEKRKFDPSREHVVAAYLSDYDFHFARLDRTGLWSHKQGSLKPRQTDFRGKIIRHPDKAQMHSYDFVAYFTVPPVMPFLNAN